MIKKRKFLLILIVCILSLTSFSFANMNNIPIENDKLPIENQDANQIASMSENIIGTNKEFYLILNLSNIEFAKFKVDIVNTSSLRANEVTLGVSELSTNSVVTSFEVDKKSISLDKLGIIYTAPKEECVIKFEIKITNLDKTKADLEEDLKILETELKTLNTELEELNETLNKIKQDFEKAKEDGLDAESKTYKEFEKSITDAEEKVSKKKADIEIKQKEQLEISEKIKNFKEEILMEELEIEVSNTKQDMSDKEKEFDKDEMFPKEDKEKKDMMDKMNDLELNLKDANNKISSLTKGETYQGSQNNYLKSLEIEGVTFKNAFKKTTLTYFAEVKSDVSNVIVNATQEDSSAIVTVYGNTDLKEGKNKIIITITADDGSVRTYIVYLTK